MTSDSEILQIVSGCKIEFENETVPEQDSVVYSSFFNQIQSQVIDQEIKKLLSLQVLEKVEHEEGEFIPTIFLRFLRKKKNGTYRMILNLKEFSKSVKYHHFKMETFESAIKLIKTDCFIVSIDIKDAYYSVPIHTSFRKYLRFYFDNTYTIC